jgi:hypothetical protein
MTRIRLVTPGEDGAPMSFADALRAATERVIAKSPVAVVLIYEAETYGAEAVPPSEAVKVGLIHEYVTATSPEE